MIVRDLIRKQYRFDRAQTYSTTPGQDGWTIKDTSSAGTPTYANVGGSGRHGGAAKLLLDNTDEAQIVTLYQNNILFLDPGKIHYFKFIIDVSGMASTNTLVAGLASAQADDPDNITQSLWVKIDGSASTSALWVECDDDSSNTLDDIATGKSLGTTPLEVVFNFANRGPGDIEVVIDGARVAESKTFKMTNAVGTVCLQPFFQLQKSGADTDSSTPALFLSKAELCYEECLGA